MRVWIDLTNSPHVRGMRPVIGRLRADGHDVAVTARDFAQTLELCERFGIEYTAIGHHRGGRVAAKATGLASRTAAPMRWARRGNGPAGAWREASESPFCPPLWPGSKAVTVPAPLLRVSRSTIVDHALASVQHNVHCRLA